METERKKQSFHVQTLNHWLIHQCDSLSLQTQECVAYGSVTNLRVFTAGCAIHLQVCQLLEQQNQPLGQSSKRNKDKVLWKSGTWPKYSVLLLSSIYLCLVFL